MTALVAAFGCAGDDSRTEVATALGEPGAILEPTVTGDDARSDVAYLFEFLHDRFYLPSSGPMPRLIDFLPNTHGRYVDAPEPYDAGELTPGSAIVIGEIVEVREGATYDEAEDDSGARIVDQGSPDVDWSILHLTVRVDEHFGDIRTTEANTVPSAVTYPAGVDVQRLANGLLAIGPALFVLSNDGAFVNSGFLSSDAWALAGNAAFIGPLPDGDTLVFPILEQHHSAQFIEDSPTLTTLRERAAEPVRFRDIVRRGDSWDFAPDPAVTTEPRPMEDSVPTGG